jgi:hypothetical protein
VPDNEIHIRLTYDIPDHQTLRLAATIEGSPNLRSWATRTLLDHARRVVADYRTQAPTADPQEGEPCTTT